MTTIDLQLNRQAKKFNCSWDVLKSALIGRSSSEDNDRKFAVPSAGALFPYDFDFAMRGGSSTKNQYEVPLSLLESMLSAWSLTDLEELTLTLNFKPAIATRKYGERGIIYGIQDCGHVLANLQLAAVCHGIPYVVTRIPFAKSLSQFAAAPNRVPIFRVTLGKGEFRPGVLSSGHSSEHVLAAMRKRTSAHTFAKAAGPDSAVRAVLNSAWRLSKALPVDTSAVQFNLAQRKGDSWHLSNATGLSELCEAKGAPRQFDPVGMFCNQAFTANAHAVLMVSAPVTKHNQTMRHSLDLGQIGQCLYIAAGLQPLGACCVGGFEYDLAAKSFGMDSQRYAAYAMLLGKEGPSLPKIDRNRKPTPRKPIVPIISPAPSGETLHASV